MRKIIIAAIIGAVALMGTYGATLANGSLSHTVEATDADLVLTKSDSPDPAQVGANLTYTLTVANHGPATSTDVTLEDTLPGSVTFVSASTTSGSCSESSGVVTCDLGDLSLDEVATSTIVVIPNVAMEITNTAHVHGNENDPNESNNDSVEVTTVVASPGQADLSVHKAGSPDPVLVGGSLTFTMEVVNNGPATSTGVTLVDTLPAEVTFTSATATSGSCSISGSVVTCAIGTLLPDESATATIIVVADQAGDIVNSVEVHADQVDPVPGNNSAAVTITAVEVATEMQVDIKPGSERNPLNLRSRGVLPVAIIGATDFDVHDIDVTTVRFGVDGDNAAPAHRRRGHIEDINGDGIDDMMLHFRTQALGISGDVERGAVITLALTGELEEGTHFDGEDTVTIVGMRPFMAGFRQGVKWARDHAYVQFDGEDDDPSKGKGRGNGKSFSPNDRDDEDRPSQGRGNGRGRGFSFDDSDDGGHPSEGRGNGRNNGRGKGRR